MMQATAENAFVESFNGRLRDECLNETLFSSLDEARILLAAWRDDYNQTRPHSSLANRTPEEFKDHAISLAITTTNRQYQPQGRFVMTGGKLGLRSPPTRGADQAKRGESDSSCHIGDTRVSFKPPLTLDRPLKR